MRIENKSVEIQTKIARKEIDKTYILNAYAPYLDATRDIYRMEMTLDFKKLRAQNHRHCYSKVGNPFETITKSEYKILSDYKKAQYHLVDSQLPKAIPLTLLRDQDFLFSFFAQYSIFNYTKIMSIKKPILLKILLLQPIAYVHHVTTITQYNVDEKKIIKYHIKSKSTVEVEVDLNEIASPVRILPKGIDFDNFFGF
jgi:hypothetical protein